jgi:hypothetical protein
MDALYFLSYLTIYGNFDNCYLPLHSHSRTLAFPQLQSLCNAERNILTGESSVFRKNMGSVIKFHQSVLSRVAIGVFMSRLGSPDPSGNEMDNQGSADYSQLDTFTPGNALCDCLLGTEWLEYVSPNFII